ncbi:hypothetical protein HDF18_18325 [Mucilaginibacter sp. X5P1]|uniref:hypothetical protein n=1 Tax=Mucilaginibacter sp. X5P1 TaxID=2723088 RepID=UPI00161038D0|nr:hypothetical protein [Mucilaginibacter sp. X5P1]MBB6139598.1 hypothetical protein [Mucilaginibacter sp. X5P1]
MGSIFLPLSDFSLAGDIPNMYHSYEKIASRGDADILDFIGDYLLAGKALLGHNKKDKPESAGMSVQFQHSPASMSFLYNRVESLCISIKDFKIDHTQLKNPVATTDFHPELFRPPLA